jgi:hypothetical protein
MNPITSIKQLPIISCYNESLSVTSSDSERNSHGSCSHGSVFEIESMSSSQEDIQVFEQNPCKIDNVQNCCNYSCESIFLLKDFTIVCINVNTYEKRYITNNRDLVDVVSFNGYLYGLNRKGNLFMLCNAYYDNSYWVWKKVIWAPKNIVAINATLNSNYLLIQSKKNYIYDVNFKSTKLKFKGIRIYGSDETCYLDFHENTCYVYVNNQKVEVYQHVMTGAMDHHHNLYLIRNHCEKVRMINYEPYYY